MPNTFTIARGDLLPVLTWAATYSDGTIVDLTAATSPKFIMRRANTTDPLTPKISATATVVNGPAGTLRYAWSGTDTDTAGTYLAEFEVTLGGKKLTIPNRRNDKIVIIVSDDHG